MGLTEWKLEICGFSPLCDLHLWFVPSSLRMGTSQLLIVFPPDPKNEESLGIQRHKFRACDLGIWEL